VIREVGDEDDVERALADALITVEGGDRRPLRASPLSGLTSARHGDAAEIGVENAHEPSASLEQDLAQGEGGVSEHCDAPSPNERLGECPERDRSVGPLALGSRHDAGS
jgi:hypothetical protein